MVYSMIATLAVVRRITTACTGSRRSAARPWSLTWRRPGDAVVIMQMKRLRFSLRSIAVIVAVIAIGLTAFTRSQQTYRDFTDCVDRLDSSTQAQLMEDAELPNDRRFAKIIFGPVLPVVRPSATGLLDYVLFRRNCSVKFYTRDESGVFEDYYRHESEYRITPFGSQCIASTDDLAERFTKPSQ